LLTAKYTRITTIEQQQPYQIQVDLTNNKFQLATSEFNEDTGQTTSKTIQNYYCKPIEFIGNIRFEDVQVAPIASYSSAHSDNEKAITFWPNGTADSAVIQIGDGKTHYTISIDSSTGRAMMYFGRLENVEVGSVDLDAE
jgi:hypothetical protein